MQLSESSPFNELQRQEQVILAFSKGLPSAKTQGQTWVGMSFLSGNYVLLMPLNEIVEILPVPLIAPIPSVRSWMRGIGTCRQELFPITDLSEFLMGKETFVTKHARVLMMQYQEGYCGLLVDKVLGLQRIARDQMYEKMPEGFTSAFDPYIIGAFLNERIELPIVSLKAIVQEPRFRDAALKKQEIVETRE